MSSNSWPQLKERVVLILAIWEFQNRQFLLKIVSSRTRGDIRDHSWRNLFNDGVLVFTEIILVIFPVEPFCLFIKYSPILLSNPLLFFRPKIQDSF